VELAEGRFAPDFLADLRCCGVASGSIDWLFCSHVLEHVDDLDACLAEMVRMLRPGGVAWIQVPLEPGLQRSRRIPIDPRRAHAHAWQFGRDFSQLLTRSEWAVKEVAAEDSLDAAKLRFYGIDPEERYWLTRKV
jgi:SAM-dependent methyltransferase